MTAFHVSSATFNVYFPVLLCFCNKVLIENDRKHYLSTTYVIFGIESQGESLHSARKCCIFARKRLRIYTIVVFSFVRTFAPSF